jgi:hyperosmotically inducible protein
MSTRIHLVPLALSLLLGLPACASRQSMGEQVDDATLQMRVGRALIADPGTSAMEIDVDVIDGVVYLKGDVDSEEERMQAGRVAANTVGVKEVKNDLQIEGMMPEDEDSRSDIAIRTAVGTRLTADPDASRMNIDVDVVNGVVYLTGIVADEREKAAAERVAKGVEGVKEVKNQLQIEKSDQKAAPGGPDDQPESMPEGDRKSPDMDEPDMDPDMDMDEPMQPE